MLHHFPASEMVKDEIEVGFQNGQKEQWPIRGTRCASCVVRANRWRSGF